MKTTELSFPTTVEAFLSYQEVLIGEKLCGYNREAISEWVPVFNDCYEDGRRHDCAALENRLDLMNKFMEEQKDSPLLYKMLKSSKSWMVVAWDRGRRDAEEETA